MLAAIKGYTNIARLLIEHGADVNQEIYFGQTALVYAIKFNKPIIIKSLLESGADINVQVLGKPILDYAKSRNFNEILKAIKDFVKSHQKLLIEEGLPKEIAELTVEFETGLKKK